MTFGPANTLSSYLPIEFQVQGDEEFFRQLIAERQRLISSIVNIKENAQYEKRELLSGQQWFTSMVAGATKSNYVLRLSFDLTTFNAPFTPSVPVPIGVTNFVLNADPAVTQPASINVPTNIFPVHGFGAASNGTNFYFINDPLLFVRTNVWTNALQQVTVTNNTGAPLTWCVWVMEYIKT